MRWVWFRVAAAIVALSGVAAGLLVNLDRAMRESQDRTDVLANYYQLDHTVIDIDGLGPPHPWIHSAVPEPVQGAFAPLQSSSAAVSQISACGTVSPMHGLHVPFGRHSR